MNQDVPLLQGVVGSRSSGAFWLNYRETCSGELAAEPLKTAGSLLVGGGQKGDIWHQGRTASQESVWGLFEAMNLGLIMGGGLPLIATFISGLKNGMY